MNARLLLASALFLLVAGPPVVAYGSPTPPPTSEPRHASGLVVLSPPDLTNFPPVSDLLSRAWTDAYELGQANPDAFGYPWADGANTQLVLSIADAKGEAIAKDWMTTGMTIRSGTKQLDLRPPQVPVRFRNVDRSWAQLEEIEYGIVRGGPPSLPDGDLIYELIPDWEHNRVLVVIDHLSDRLLFALAARYGTEAIAIQVEERHGTTTEVQGGASFAPIVEVGIGVGAALALAALVLWMRRRAA